MDRVDSAKNVKYNIDWNKRRFFTSACNLYNVEAKCSIACVTSSIASGFSSEKYLGIDSSRYALSNAPTA